MAAADRTPGERLHPMAEAWACRSRTLINCSYRRYMSLAAPHVWRTTFAAERPAPRTSAWRLRSCAGPFQSLVRAHVGSLLGNPRVQTRDQNRQRRGDAYGIAKPTTKNVQVLGLSVPRPTITKR